MTTQGDHLPVADGDPTFKFAHHQLVVEKGIGIVGRHGSVQGTYNFLGRIVIDAGRNGDLAVPVVVDGLDLPTHTACKQASLLVSAEEATS